MKRIIEEVVKLEWDQFQLVNENRARASCQDDWQQFNIMRSSQFMSWDEKLLESYKEDLENAKINGKNLIFNKYAYMMERTDPAGYKRIRHVLPEISELQKEKLEKAVQIHVVWAEIFEEKYPAFARTGRPVHAREERFGQTSIETYQRGELYSYGPKTRNLYFDFICRCCEENRNLTMEVRENMAKMYGYASLEDAERSRNV